MRAVSGLIRNRFLLFLGRARTTLQDIVQVPALTNTIVYGRQPTFRPLAPDPRKVALDLEPALS
jgi:hypothetical protein